MIHPEFESKNYDTAANILDAVARKNFGTAEESLKSLSSGFGFYPDEYKVQDDFCKAIRVELAAVGKAHYHQEIAHRIDYIFDGAHFNLYLAILNPAISYERKIILNNDKLEESIKFYSERGEVFDIVIASVFTQIKTLTQKMNSYCEGK